MKSQDFKTVREQNKKKSHRLKIEIARDSRRTYIGACNIKCLFW